MGRFVQIVLVVLAIPLVVGGYMFANHLTVRNVSAPDAVYSVPYATHGGTVYISPDERNLLNAGWAAGGALVVAQLVLNAVRRRQRGA
ncbi:hypothetical protein [Caulobacter sp. 17J65-9]|uniref:hypothetical protein n=1 Tax=Caulobacter sp. 17J65-9 TaxID=2709382 RepID=UPI0013CDD548|nr:hypothetical protein [Caulobacter sp. 17J65-9]NEX94245.1 hypothetical protein [Caulobacter sp. 17J65-9]